MNHKVITAIKTPFNKKGKIDFNVYSKMVQRQIDNNVKALVISGTTGEGHLMNWTEQIMLIKHTVDLFGNEIDVIANVGANCTNEAMRATEYAFGLGIDCALQINPYYGKVCEEGMYRHLNSLLDFGPSMVYNVPGRTGQDVPESVIRKLNEHENFIGVKECHSLNRVKIYTGLGINVWSGNDDEAPAAYHNYNSNGVISVISNIIPEFTNELMEPSGNWNEKNSKNNILFNWLFQKPNPIGVNTALAMMGITEPVFRMPYIPLCKEERVKGKEILETHFKVENVNVLEDEDFTVLKYY